METEAFNTEKFIDEIEKRPAIWDMTSSCYSNKILRRKSWEEIIIIFCYGNETSEKKKKLSTTLQKKWKHLRDNYLREVKKLKNVKSGSGASKTSTYIHYNRLQFLQPSIANKDTESSFNADNYDATSIVPDAEEVAHTEIRPAFKISKSNLNKKPKLNPADERFANLLEQTLTQNNNSYSREHHDEDKLFCLSLIKEIKKIPDYKRLKVKIDIYNLLLQNQSPIQERQHQQREIDGYLNSLPQRRTMSQQQRSHTSDDRFHVNGRKTTPQQSSMPNNIELHGYSTVDRASPITTPIPSPAPTNVSNGSELELFFD